MARITYYLCLLSPLLIPVLSGTPEPRTNAVTDPTKDLLRLPSSRNLSSYADILHNIPSIVNSSDPQDTSQDHYLTPDNSSSSLSPNGPLGAYGLLCEKESWGAPSLASCQQAIDSIPSDNTLFKIGKRGKSGNYGATLPWQVVVSRKHKHFHVTSYNQESLVKISLASQPR